MKKKVLIGIIVLVGLIVGLIIVGIGWYFTSHAPAPSEKTILENFIRENLKEVYLPKELNPINRLTSSGRTDGDVTLYGAIWNIGDVSFYTNLHWNDVNKSGIKNIQIFVSLPEPIELNALNENKAASLINQYFKIKNTEKIRCNTTFPNVTFCENFWVENDNKKGVIIISNFYATTPFTFLGMCEYPKGSRDYEFQTCLRAPST